MISEIFARMWASFRAWANVGERGRTWANVDHSVKPDRNLGAIDIVPSRRGDVTGFRAGRAFRCAARAKMQGLGAESA